MAEQQLFWVGNQEPSIADVITNDDGTPFDLSGYSVKFKMRPLGSSTLTVNATVSNTPGADGVVRYDWNAADVDTAGQYLVWWEVTDSAGHTQDMNEAVIEFRAHGPLSNGYIELEELKSSTELTSTSFADQDLKNAIVAASRSIDLETGQRFYPDPDATQVRYYTANGGDTISIDPLLQLTSIQTDPSADGTFPYTWTLNTDFVLEPRSALADGYPYTSIRKTPYGTYWWPSYSDAVKVTGKFGWATPPAAVKVATTMLAARFVKRMREAPFGVAGFDATGATVRISQSDPDVARLLAPYVRRVLFA